MQARLARQIKAYEPDVSAWVSGERQVPARFAVLLELATNGAVTCEELRPDVPWLRVKRKRSWPHPDGAPVLDLGAMA